MLVITQILDKEDSILGFFHDWILEFAKYEKEVIVICLKKGKFDLPSNVRVLSLGKEEGISRIKYLIRFYYYIWKERKNYKKVFVHMNQIYIVLAGWFWRLTGKQIGLWYTHKQVTLSLRVAHFFADYIFTAAKESFQIESNKVHVLGHGIKTSLFEMSPKITGDTIVILHMGRITPIKNCDVAITAAQNLKKLMLNKKIKLVFAGDALLPSDFDYKRKLLEQAKAQSEIEVSFPGAPGYSEIRKYFEESDVTWNLVPTGGLDKSAISGFIAKRPTFTSNEAFRPVLGDLSSNFIVKFRDSDDFASKTKDFFDSTNGGQMLDILSQKIEKEYSTEALVSKIKNIYGTSSR